MQKFINVLRATAKSPLTYAHVFFDWTATKFPLLPDHDVVWAPSKSSKGEKDDYATLILSDDSFVSIYKGKYLGKVTERSGGEYCAYLEESSEKINAPNSLRSLTN